MAGWAGQQAAPCWLGKRSFPQFGNRRVAATFSSHFFKSFYTWQISLSLFLRKGCLAGLMEELGL
jgi:hypothetical protein